jgi:hypothetical protein
MNIGSIVVLVKDYPSETISFFNRHGVPIPQKDTEYEVASVVNMPQPHPFRTGIVLREYMEYRVCFNIEDWSEVSRPSLRYSAMVEAGV